MRWKSWALTVPLIATASGCSSAPPPALTPKDPTPLAKCSVAKNQASPLVTEWPASEKSHLESMLGSQAVVVSYSGCEMRILANCRVGGDYDFRRTTLSEDTIEIKNSDELYAKVPLGAASLEAELAASGRLAIQTTVVGQLRLASDVVVPETRGCDGATHVITAVSVGAFELLSGGAFEAGGGVSVASAGVGARHKSEESQLRSAGNKKACRETGDEPHIDCRSPLQVFLSPVDREGDAPVAAVTRERPSVDERPEPLEPGDETEVGRPEDEPEPIRPAIVEPKVPSGPPKKWDEPPREKSVEVHFAAPEADTNPDRWMVMSPEGDVLCKLPCVRRVGNESGIRIQLDADRKEDIKVIPLPDDLGYSPGRRVRAVPELGGPSHWAPGITTAVGVVATGAGIGMMVAAAGGGSVDCGELSGDSATLCTGGTVIASAGILTLLIGAGWWLSVGSNERHGSLDLTLIEGESAKVRIDLAPSGVIGRF